MRYTTIYNDPVRRSTVTEPWCYWDGAFTDEELQKVIDYCESKDLKSGITFGGKTPEEIEKVRISKIGFHSRSPETAWIFDRVNFVLQSANEMFYGFELNGYTSFQYTTYDADQKGNYDWHMDINMGSPTLALIKQRRFNGKVGEPAVVYRLTLLVVAEIVTILVGLGNIKNIILRPVEMIHTYLYHQNKRI